MSLLRKQEKRSQSTCNRIPTRPKPTSSARLLQIATRFVSGLSTSLLPSSWRSGTPKKPKPRSSWARKSQPKGSPVLKFLPLVADNRYGRPPILCLQGCFGRPKEERRVLGSILVVGETRDRADEPCSPP